MNLYKADYFMTFMGIGGAAMGTGPHMGGHFT
jgi:hypothetical protein